MISAREIVNGFLDKSLMGPAYYRGVASWFLEIAGFEFERIAEWIGHPDVDEWPDALILSQAMMMVGGIRDERIHDVTISSLGEPTDPDTEKLLQLCRDLHCP